MSTRTPRKRTLTFLSVLLTVVIAAFVATGTAEMSFEKIHNLIVPGTCELSGTTTISGAATFSGALTASGTNTLSGNTTVSGTLTSSGSTTSITSATNSIAGTTTTISSATTTLSGTTTGVSGALEATGTTKIGATGTVIDGMRCGILTIGTSDTSGTLTLTGAQATDIVTATIMTGNTSSRSVILATPGSGIVQVVLSGAPGASTTVGVVAIDPH